MRRAFVHRFPYGLHFEISSGSNYRHRRGARSPGCHGLAVATFRPDHRVEPTALNCCGRIRAMTRSRCPCPDRWGIALKRFVVSMLVALCLVVPSVGHSQSADPRMGSWRLVQVSVDSRDQPAGNSTWVYSQEGSGLRVDVHIVTPTGQPQHWSYQTKRDGVEVRVLGNPAIDHVAVTHRNDWLDEIVHKEGWRGYHHRHERDLGRRSDYDCHAADLLRRRGRRRVQENQVTMSAGKGSTRRREQTMKRLT